MKTKIYKLSAVLIIIMASLLISSPIFAQAFEKISYQAVIRDANDNLVTNQTIGMQVHILVGAGTAYIETHTPTTNANGLVSIEVGGGTPVSGMWSMIYWAYGECYIKTDVDPTGGTNYTITATSQLLGVPYAIYAETAINADTAGVALTAQNVIVYTAGAGIDITNSVISATSISTKYAVGDFAQGGIVFWVDETGEHGLVCAKEDFSSLRKWNGELNNSKYAYGDGIFAGEMNTSLIIARTNSYSNHGAAYSCALLQILEGGNNYGDWYLPSKEELSLMCQNKTIINTAAIANGGSAFANDVYWSSTETAHDLAQVIVFTSCGWYSYYKDEQHYVRAIRAF